MRIDARSLASAVAVSICIVFVIARPLLPQDESLTDRIHAYAERLMGITQDITLGATSRTETTGIDGSRGWPNITRGLVARGFSDENIRKIVGGNFVRYWRRVSAHAKV